MPPTGKNGSRELESEGMQRVAPVWISHLTNSDLDVQLPFPFILEYFSLFIDHLRAKHHSFTSIGDHGSQGRASIGRE